MVLNNIACCNFQLGNSKMALSTLQEARNNQQKHAAGSSAKADLDLLHSAITLSNYGYLKLHLKQYEDAAACFEEALLVSVSNNRESRRKREDWFLYFLFRFAVSLTQSVKTLLLRLLILDPTIGIG